jgi:nitroreductase
MNKKTLGLIIISTVFAATFNSVSGNFDIVSNKEINKIDIAELQYYSLPPPLTVDMVLEETISRRMSVRSFLTDAVTNEELSTILWAAYGFNDNGERNIFSPDGTFSTIIYVIRNDATYKYVPSNHSLSLYVSGNYLHLGQYTSPIKFGLVWDMNISSNETKAMAEIGMIGQNIYFDANALNLGVVTTGMYVDDLYQLGLPANEKPAIIMPLGHPSTSYDFTYNPPPASNLPLITNNSKSLADALNDRTYAETWYDIPLSIREQSQLLWASYGTSYLYDNLNNKRHRTLPSAIGYYPYKIFAVNHSGVYEYLPNTHSSTDVVFGDRRILVNSSIESGSIIVPSSPFILIPCLDINIGVPQYQSFWYYEVGAILHNILIEATALNLSANAIYNISDISGLRSALGISSQTNLIPLAVIPAGNACLNKDNLPISNLSSQWNFISLPFNHSINKSDVIVNYANENYSWNTAVSNNWVSDYVFGWNRAGQSYTFNDVFQPGYGYWIYAYEPCVLWVENITLQTDSYVTDLYINWNTVGVPHSEDVSKTSMVVNDFSWGDAVSTGIISDYVFGWNRETQSYFFADTFEPGESYWLYAYQSSILIRST